MNVLRDLGIVERRVVVTKAEMACLEEVLGREYQLPPVFHTVSLHPDCLTLRFVLRLQLPSLRHVLC